MILSTRKQNNNLGMKKSTATIVLLLTFISTIAQISTATFAGKQCLVKNLPKPGNTSPKDWVLFAPGSGESVIATGKTAAYELEINGPFAPWNGHPGISDTTAIDTNVVVVAIEPNEAAGLQFTECNAIISQINQTYPVNALAVTGLSLGSQTWTNYAFSSYSNFKQIQAFFLFSSDPTQVPQYGGWPTQPSWFYKDSAYYYGGCGTADVLFYNMQFALYDSIATYPEYRKPEFTSVNGAGHSAAAWGQFYSPYWIDPATGRNIYQQFVYEYPIGKPVVVVTKPTPTVKTLVYVVQTAVYSDSSKVQFIIK